MLMKAVLLCLGIPLVDKVVCAISISEFAVVLAGCYSLSKASVLLLRFRSDH